MDAELPEGKGKQETSLLLRRNSLNGNVQQVRRAPVSSTQEANADGPVKILPRSSSANLSKSKSCANFRHTRSASSIGPPDDASSNLPMSNYRTASRETAQIHGSFSDSPTISTDNETNNIPALTNIVTEGRTSTLTLRRRGLILSAASIDELDLVERDQYGFDKASIHIDPETTKDFETVYAPILSRRKAKWEQLLKETGGVLPPPSMKVKRYIRKGIPSNIRGKCWLHYSGAETLMKQNAGVYQDIVKRSENIEGDLAYETIERDLHRTFPENIKFKSKKKVDGGTIRLSTDNVPAIQSLRRVLRAFALYFPSVGYCQSLNYICGLLLLFMTEEEVFWTLTNTVQNMLPEGVYGVTMEGSTIDQEVLMELLIERIPEVAEKLGCRPSEDVPSPTLNIVRPLRYRSTKSKARMKVVKQDITMPPISLVTSTWFLTLYINVLPVETVLRVWDAFFYEGEKVLFRVALSLFKLHAAAILEIKEPLEIFQYVQNMPKRMVNCHLIMEHCFLDEAANLSRKEIKNLRDICRKRRRKKYLPRELL